MLVSSLNDSGDWRWRLTVCGDFDGDGNRQAMFSDREGGLWCIATATGTLKWRMNQSIRPSAGVSADIDSDGRDEALLIRESVAMCRGPAHFVFGDLSAIR